MVRKSYGKMRGTRKKMASREKMTITKHLVRFKTGDTVHIKLSANTKFQHPRFHGLTGKITEVRGNGYAVQVKDGNKMKTVFVRPESLRLQK
jgi:large subunit ribosomal protein L21e